MYIKQIYTNCLAQAAYYIESEGEAAIIDPLRDVASYIELAKQRGAKIRYVFETHFHADFVSGHLELSRLTGAVIVFGPRAKPSYQALSAIDGEIFYLGAIKIKVLHTPGHTLESCCYLLYDRTGIPYCVFTGDTLFAGDVGRPDLLSGNLGKEELAGMLYDSLNKKIKMLPDQVIVYPGHGAGSACGRNIGKETVTTIGEQKKNNYALQPMSREEFIETVTSGLPVPPPYFFKDAAINIQGYESFDKVIKSELKPLDMAEFRKLSDEGALILDTRSAADFLRGYIAGSLNIGLNGQFAYWVGTLIEFGKPVILVCDEGRETESVTRLARVGYENVKGFLAGGLNSWSGELQNINSIAVAELDAYRREYDPVVLDVREAGETEKFTINDSLKIPLSILGKNIPHLDKSMTYLLCCAGGYRSAIACSLLRKNGFHFILNLQEGINAYAELKKSKL